MGAIDRDTLRAWSRADRWLLACPIVLAVFATAAALADRPEPTRPMARAAEVARLEFELRILQAEVDLIRREIDRIDIIDRKPYYDRRPLRVEDIEVFAASAERLEAFGKRTRGVHWSEFPEL